MIITNARSSSINTFRQCPMAYFMEYVLGWYSGVNKAAIKGTVVHAVLENLAKIKLAHQQKQNSIILDIDLSILKVNDYLKDDLINQLIDKLYLYHINKEPGFYWCKQDKNDCINWTKKTLTKWNGQFDPRHRHIIGPEIFFNEEIIKPWSAYKYTLPNREELKGFFSIKGTIDLTTRLDDNIIEIVDYKTGQRKDWAKDTKDKKTMTDLKNDIQPRMYHYVMAKRYPDKQIMVTMLYINDGGPFSIYFSDADIEKTENILQSYYQSIRESEPVCHKSWKCSKFCEYGKTSFDNTSVIPLVRNGQYMTKCAQMEYVLQYKTQDQVIANMCNGNLLKNLDKYQQG